MKLAITHTLLYDYSSDVWLEPHYLYLYPKQGPYLKVEKYSLQILPSPDFISKNIDSADNIQHIVFFNKSTRQLSIKAESMKDFVTKLLEILIMVSLY